VGPDDLVFVNERGLPISENHAADRYREHLAAAGIDRPVLFEKSKARRPIRIHDTRATFITVSLANGKSEAWVQDRTGHKSSIMINRYRRAARTAAELGLGDLRPLDQTIPELANLLREKATEKATLLSDLRKAGIQKALRSRLGSPTQIRTGTPSRAEDFKGGHGRPRRREQRRSPGFWRRFGTVRGRVRRFGASLRRFEARFRHGCAGARRYSERARTEREDTLVGGA
jgi:hypothetical protein